MKFPLESNITSLQRSGISRISNRFTSIDEKMVCVAAKDKNSIILPIAKELIEPPSILSYN